MKTVFDNDMVAHVWAQQTQIEGRSNNGNFWFKDNVIYSYRTPIAVIHKSVLGENVCLVTSQRYSVTTSGKHMPAIYRGLGYGRIMPYFVVPVIGKTNSLDYGVDTLIDHSANIAYFTKQYDDYKAKLTRVREFDAQSAITDLDRLFNIAWQYCQHFGLSSESVAWLPISDAVKIKEYRDIRDSKLNTPQAIAKREKDRVKRATAKIVKEEQLRKELFERQEEKRIAWLNGEDHSYFRGHDLLGGALLRVKGDELQTSQGASVPIEHAKKAFTVIKTMREHGKEWIRNGHTIHVGHFQIDKITPNGDIKAGCHLINWPEIDRIAKQLNL